MWSVGAMSGAVIELDVVSLALASRSRAACCRALGRGKKRPLTSWRRLRQPRGAGFMAGCWQAALAVQEGRHMQRTLALA
jgi:hypothetical protein